ncbi:GGDEF domain-containing protein [Dongia rigui]|uniref:diguanylate cyclase n=1 Tax=Dongia rigui TaxID=940149 RepID=A0ABU5E2Y1_9PROT|nr:GGDEF domain-containing protein [Dongia rigui]MDY0873974.1 GGDEF domain-containing protein [Dongia rigui]
MKIRDRAGGPTGIGPAGGARPVSKVAKAAKTAAAASVDSATSAAPVDQATFLGLSENELSPNVRAALTALLDEVRSLRDELDRTRKRISHLERVADEDAMLPIANRRAFVRELTRLISFSERYGSPGSVLYFDLNGMKQINDRFGHPAGDAALKHFATLLVNNVRDSDVVGRLGGDEFGVILAQADVAQAQDKANQLLSVISTSPLNWDGYEIQLSCAVGLHEFHGQQSADDALSQADASMYQAKRKHYAVKNGADRDAAAGEVDDAADEDEAS